MQNAPHRLRRDAEMDCPEHMFYSRTKNLGPFPHVYRRQALWGFQGCRLHPNSAVRGTPQRVLEGASTATLQQATEARHSLIRWGTLSSRYCSVGNPRAFGPDVSLSGYYAHRGV